MKFKPGNLVQIEASRCHANGRVNSRSGHKFFPGKPLPMNERYYAARFGCDFYGNPAMIIVPCSTMGIYVSEHAECPDRDLFPDYEDVIQLKGQHIVHKVLFPDLGKFIYIENNFLKRVIK